MNVASHTIGLLLLALLLVGCSSFPYNTVDTTGALSAASEAPSLDSEPTGQQPQAEVIATDQPGTKKDNPAALSAVMAELQTLGALDPAAQAQLMEDLHNSDPAVWPQLVQVFKATVEYRRQAQQSNTAQLPAAVPVHTAAYDWASSTSPSAQTATAPPLTMAPPLESAPPRPANAAFGATTLAAPSAPEVSSSDQAKAMSPAATPDTAANNAPATAKTSTPTAAQATLSAPPTSNSNQTDWQQALHESIQALESQTRGTPQSSDEIGQHASLRMLYLIAGQREEALKTIPGISAAQQDFWSKQLYGLSTYLDAEKSPDASRRAAEAALHLREAITRLGEQAPLVVRNLAFCSEVNSYGVYKKFDAYEFKPGQELLLYAEIENFKSEPTDKGFHTVLKSSYQILDSRGARVADQEFATTEEHCQNPRRDFFIRYFVWVPKRIYNGTYTLQLTIEDVNSRKIGQSSIEFTVKEKDQ